MILAPPHSARNGVASMKTYHQLTQEERYRITAHRMCGTSQVEIARLLQRHPSTMGGSCGATRPTTMATTEPRRRTATRRPGAGAAAAGRTSAPPTWRGWPGWCAEGSAPSRSPGCGRRPAPCASVTRRSTGISDGTGGREATCGRHTRIMSKFARKRYRSHDSRGVLPGKRPISERPVEVELRQRIGHWEGDTVMGSDLRHCVLTLVERKTGYAIIKKLKARKMERSYPSRHPRDPHALPKVQDDHLRQRHRVPRLRPTRTTLPDQGLLRHAVPLVGARQQRELQRPAASVFAQGQLHEGGHPDTLRPDRRRSQQPTPQTTWLQHTRRAVSSKLISVALAR